MADKFKIQDEVKSSSSSTESARGYDAKLQLLGKTLIASLYMLIRNVKLYSPENSIFDMPLEKLKECINTIIISEGNLSLQGAGNTFYLNNMLLRIESKAIENVRHLRDEFERCNVGGFLLEKPITVPELRNFIFIFSKENVEETGESGVSARKLQAMKLRRYEKIEEILSSDAEQELSDEKLDRKRYSLVVYSRTFHYMRKYFAGLRGHGPVISINEARRCIQDLVDVCHGHHSHFLGLSSQGFGEEDLCFHSVNVAVLSIVFGSEIGLSKERLHQLGTAALFHDIGMVDIDPDVAMKTGQLSPEESAELDKSRFHSVSRFLTTGQLSNVMFHCIVNAYEHKTTYGKVIKDLSGNVQLVEQSAELCTYTKIIAITDIYCTLTAREGHTPEIAFTMMRTDLAHKFDPIFIKIFAKILRGMASKQFDEGQDISIF